MDKLVIAFHLAEMLAALVGTWYIIKFKSDKQVTYFVYFLWLTLGVELFGLFVPKLIMEGHLEHLKDTFLRKNYWLYNTFSLASFLFYTWFFRAYLQSKVLRKLMAITLLTFLVTAGLNLIFSNVFFSEMSSYTFIFGSLMLLMIVGFYFFEMFQSDEILNFKYILQFYIGIGTMTFYLCITPLFLYSSYFSEHNTEFVYAYRIILRSSIVLLYSLYAFGFVICSKKRKSY